MIVLNACFIGSQWFKLITSSQKYARLGHVINVFKSSINIKTSSGMLLTITTRRNRSPIYVNICNKDVNFRNIVKAFTEVILHDNFILIDNLKINISNSQIYESTLSRIKRNLNVNAQILANILEEFINKGFLILYIAGIIPKSFKFDIRGLIYDLASYTQGRLSADQIIKKLSSILGFGDGFTPFTDDIVTGILGTLNVFMIYYNFGRPIYLPLNLLERRTHWVSAQIINYAQKGILIEEFENAIIGIITLNIDKFTDSVLNLLSFGHSSGSGIILGILIALSAIRAALRNSLKPR